MSELKRFFILLAFLVSSGNVLGNTHAEQQNHPILLPTLFPNEENEQTLLHQRLLFKKIQQVSSYSVRSNTAFLVQNLLTRLETYPLYPYAKFQFLRYKTDLSLAEISQFQQQYPQFPDLITQLKQNWAQQAAQQQNWQEILENAPHLPTDHATQCILLQAQQIDPSFLSQYWAAQVQQRWLSGENLPPQCDTVVKIWSEKFLTPDLVRQRALLALEKNNGKLLTQLKNNTAQKALADWLDNLIKVQKQPSYLFSASIFHPNYPAFEAQWSKPIFMSQYPRFIKKLDESAVKNIQDPFQPYAELAATLELSPLEIQQWKKLLLSQLFDSETTALQQWRDEQLKLLRDDQLTERRIRSALREKQDYALWLELLSATSKQKDEWQYWQAKHWQQTGDMENAQKIFQQLSVKRSFYALLASVELNQSYQPPIQHFSDTQGSLTVFATELARIAEWRYHQNIGAMNKEWQQLLQQADLPQKLALAHYAHQKHWFDLSVDATIQAKAWDYLALRLPNAYIDLFDLHLTQRKINRTFAMAIARQESAWKPYVTSSANAKGLMQLLPTTAQYTAQSQGLPYSAEKQLFDPFDNIMLGTTHLQQLYDKYGQNRILIAAAYNAGAHRVDSWLNKSQSKLTMAEFVASIPFWETRGYVQNVLAYDVYYQWLQQQPQILFYPEEYQRLY